MEENKKLVLIVDDDIDQLEQSKFLISNMGFEVITADCQKEGEEILKTTKPDLAIFDLMMENKDSGFILSYKTKKKYPDVPVMIITAVTAETGLLFGIDSEEEKSWIKADKYIEKGIRSDQLQREIKKLLKM
ncbi:MAG: response regulator [Bacteroidales bacterium]|nr:response regulator [Bacteroidales bacterium]